jgi:hypothetical protein
VPKVRSDFRSKDLEGPGEEATARGKRKKGKKGKKKKREVLN